MNNKEMQERIDYLEDRLLQERWQKSYDFKSVENAPQNKYVLGLVHNSWMEGQFCEVSTGELFFETFELVYSLKNVKGWTELPDKPEEK